MTHETRILADGIYFGEAPRWHDGRLWFSDFHANAVKSVSLAGDLRVELEIQDMPSGLGWMPDGSMLVVSMRERQVLRQFPDGRMDLHAKLEELAGFHCNDMVVDTSGRAYVGNFGFDMDREVAARGMPSVIADHKLADLALVLPDGTATVAARDLDFPNGAVITPDGQTLIIGESFGLCLTAFDIASDGSLSNRRVWAHTAPRVPDGIALDANGNVWFANPMGSECVLIAEGGEVLDIVKTSDFCFACMLGGDDGHTLFMMTAQTSGPEAALTPRGKIVVTRVDTPGAGSPDAG